MHFNVRAARVWRSGKFKAIPTGLMVLAASLPLSATGQGVPGAGESPRFALVIGNSRYTEVSQLPNVANDLADMCGALQRLRFATTCLPDLPSRKAFIEAVERFVASLPPGASSVLYFGGHAVQVAGENYLVPTQATQSDSRGWLGQFVRLSEIFQLADRARAGFQFIVLDACRDDPEAARTGAAPSTAAGRSADSAGREVMRSMLRSVRGTARFASYGIAAVRDAPRNTLVLFATGAGTTAFDGDGERNGPLTKHLLREIQKPEQHVDQVIKNVIQSVGDDTERRYRQRQSPSLYGTFAGEFCFNACPRVVTTQTLEEERRRAEIERQRLLKAQAEERARREREAQDLERRRREGTVVPTL